VLGRANASRKVLLVAPMSGHYATLLRSTVISLLPDCEVYITDWHNARDIPVSEGKFDVEDYTLYLVDFMRDLGPTPMSSRSASRRRWRWPRPPIWPSRPEAQPRTLTLIGGPIDPDAAATDVTDFGRRVTMGQLEELVIQRVGFKYAGVGPDGLSGPAAAGVLHVDERRPPWQGVHNQILRVAKGEAGTTTSTTGSTTNISP
jgi:poly(3-hydroxybutyrate) depolymerase